MKIPPVPVSLLYRCVSYYQKSVPELKHKYNVSLFGMKNTMATDDLASGSDESYDRTVDRRKLIQIYTNLHHIVFIIVLINRRRLSVW